MKLEEECRGEWALITGASSGIGKEFAYQLAAVGMNLVLVARREELLDNLADELRHLYRVKILPIAQDLSQADAITTIKIRLAANEVKLRLLCNNAAFGHWGRFEDTSEKIYDEMVRVNIVAMVSMCHQFLPELASFPSSAIINVSSPAAFQPVPYMAVYAATKAFVHSFSLAIYEEWRNRGILVQTLVPGPTETEFDVKAGAYPSALKERGPVNEVVQASLRHLAADKPVVSIAKGLFKQRVFAGLFPAKIVTREVGKMFHPSAKQ